MWRFSVSVLILAAAVSLLAIGCSSSSPTAAPTKAAEPPKAAEPNKASAAQPTAASAAAPAKKVDFPQKGKTISIVVPYAAGGGTDLGARIMAASLEKDLGTSVQIINKAGAGGQVGVTDVLASKPDGYTIGYMNWPQIIPLYMDPDRKAAFTRKSIQPVAVDLADPICVAVKADSPYKGLKELIDSAKANPETVKTGDDGIMGLANLTLLQIQQATGAKFALVHFDGGAPSTTALLGGHIDASLGGTNLYQPQVKSGALRVAAIFDKQESKFLPGVKTAEEQGYNLNSPQVRGYFVPAGTPTEVVDVLVAAMKKSVESEDHKKKIDETGQLIQFMGTAQFTTLWDEMETQQKPLIEMAKKQ